MSANLCLLGACPGGAESWALLVSGLVLNIDSARRALANSTRVTPEGDWRYRAVPAGLASIHPREAMNVGRVESWEAIV